MDLKDLISGPGARENYVEMDRSPAAVVKRSQSRKKKKKVKKKSKTPKITPAKPVQDADKQPLADKPAKLTKQLEPLTKELEQPKNRIFQKDIEEIEEKKKSPDFFERNPGLSEAIIPALTTGIGLLFDAERGGAAGAQAGLIGLDKLEAQRKAKKASEKDTKESAFKEQSFYEDQKLKARLGALRAINSQIGLMESQVQQGVNIDKNKLQELKIQQDAIYRQMMMDIKRAELGYKLSQPKGANKRFQDKRVDKYFEWSNNRGNARDAISNLRSAIKELRDMGDDFNWWTGSLSRLPGPIQAKLKRIQNDINTTILPSLRQTFGSQFTASEGRLLLDTVFKAELGQQNFGLLERALNTAEKAYNRSESERLSFERDNPNLRLDFGTQVDQPLPQRPPAPRRVQPQRPKAAPKAKGKYQGKRFSRDQIIKGYKLDPKKDAARIEEIINKLKAQGAEVN